MTLPVDIEKDNGIPIYVQLEEQIRLLIRTGSIQPGDPLPTVRELAVDLAVNYNTIARVYRDLQREGVLVLRRGIGTFVAPEPSTGQGFHRLSVLETLIHKIISLGKTAGMTRGQLVQLVETKWKESEHEI